MLPLYLKLRKKIAKAVNERIRYRQARRLGIFARIPKIKIFEGNQSILVREDGSEEKITSTYIESSIEADKKELKELTPEKVLEKLDKAADEIAIQQIKSFFSEIDKAVEKIGNIVDCGGEKLSASHFFTLLRKIWLDFDHDGNPIYPVIIGDPRGADAMKEILDEISENSALKKKLDLLMAKKFEEWRDRESNRKLVG